MNMDEPQKPDTEPGAYFVSLIHETKGLALALGPFIDDHAGALARVADVNRYVCATWPARHFDTAFGTVRLPRDTQERGRLNSALNFNPTT